MDVPTVIRAIITTVVMATVALPLPSKMCKRSVQLDTSMCPLNTSIAMPPDTLMQHLYPGLFVAEQSSDTFYDDAFNVKVYKQVKKIPNVPCHKNGKCYMAKRVKREASDCCGAETSIIQLISVVKDGFEYSVVHLPSGNQYLTENACALEDATCGIGTCKSLMGLHWVLVLDPNVAYYPPVRFVMVAFKMGCTCQP